MIKDKDKKNQQTANKMNINSIVTIEIAANKNLVESIEETT